MGVAHQQERSPPPSAEDHLVGDHHIQTPVPSLVTKKAYLFDGLGNYYRKEWDLAEGVSKGFSWYHVELTKEDQKLSQFARELIQVLCPPLKLQDILSLVSNGPFCGLVDGALVFRVNSPGPPAGSFTFKLAARVTENSVITVSLGSIPRLGFSSVGRSLLSEVPSVELHGSEERGTGVFIGDHVLKFLLTMNHPEEADNPVPGSISNLVVHIIDAHLDHLQDLVTILGTEVDSVKLELDEGGSTLKKQMLKERRLPKMHLNLQHLLQVIARGEQVFPRVKEKCMSKNWLTSEDNSSLEELIGRLKMQKKNVRFLAQCVKAIQKGLDSWQADQINGKLYNLSFLAIAFLPLTIITDVFGMNVGGVPWSGHTDPEIRDGFGNVMYLCVAMVLPVLLCFVFEDIYTRVSAWRRKRSFPGDWTFRKSFLSRTQKDERKEDDFSL